MSDVVRLHYSLQTRCRFSEPASQHVFRLRVLPRLSAGITFEEESLTVTPSTPLTAPFTGAVFGNRVVTGRLDAPHDVFAFASEGIVRRDASARDTSYAPAWLAYSTPLTAAGPLVKALLKDAGVTDNDEAAVLKLLSAAHGALQYRSGSTTVETTAEAALAAGTGVCQDYSHLFLALLRLKRIPCRYCAGIVEGIGSTHAWTEVWCGGRWLALDPTAGKPCGTTHLALSHGADFTSAAIERGVLKGGGVQTIETHATCTLLS